MPTAPGKQIFVLGMKVDMVQIPDVIDFAENKIETGDYDNDVVIANANDAILCKRDPLIMETVNESSLSVPDGFSLVLLGRLYGHALKKRVYGPDLMRDFLKDTRHKGYSHFFYGSKQETLDVLTDSLEKEFPGIEIAGSYSPPFRKLSSEEKSAIIELINTASADVLWVGLGCPKQQLWMHEYKSRLKVPVIIGVGAAFDFLAGTKPQAPSWMRDNGLEWLFRLVTEPKRLWKRYLIDGSLFICCLTKELILKGLKPDVQK
jgi:N-acetylglucosaminyldiphosphoundecaprenol N-acetyl-beta-D-mannosaminyltransferase